MDYEKALRLLNPETRAEAVNEYRAKLMKGTPSDVVLESFVSQHMDEACTVACEAMKKQVPRKPEKTSKSTIRYTDSYICPNCGLGFTGTGIANYCYHCGQAIDWGDKL